ncbi:MAG: heparinase II/III family protein [Pseudomonadota bacterium]
MKSIGQMAGTRLPRHLTARLAGWGAAPGALVWQPAPPVAGDPATARRLAQGVLLMEGRLVESLDKTPWEAPAPDAVWEAALHGHDWLDHVAAAQDPKLWVHFREWMWSWLDRYGDGTGPGWSPDLVARRLTRWIAHSVDLLIGKPSEDSTRFFQALGVQARFVDWRWAETAPGVPRIEALAGLVYARLSLEGPGRETDRAIADLGREADTVIAQDGSVASRSPEDLARIVSVLAWSLRSIQDAGRQPAQSHAAAIKRALPVLRALRTPSGALARFHGGRRGFDLPLEEIVRAAGPTIETPQTAPMGYRRLARADAVLIADCAPPPTAPHGDTAHASPLAFEFSHGAQPVIVNCGTGDGFGAKAGLAARQVPAHSMLELGGACPSNLTESGVLSLPAEVKARVSEDEGALWLLGESTHYESLYGLRTERRLRLSDTGSRLEGEDTTLATSAQTRKVAARAFADMILPMTLRFHLHPSVKAGMALNGRAVSLRMPDGALWMFKADSDVLKLVPSHYFDEDRPKPRATSQIVASTELLEYWGRITWSLERLPEGSSPLQMRVS